MASCPCIEIVPVHVYDKEAVMADFDTEGNMVWLLANNSEIIALLVTT